MKISKSSINLFLKLFDKHVKCLSDDLWIYREAAKHVLSEADTGSIDLNSAAELEDLANKFFSHRIETYNDRKAGESAIEEVEKILRNGFTKQ